MSPRLANGLKRDVNYVYTGVEADLSGQIEGGLLKPHECILSENELSRKYNISRRSSRKALDNLVDRGLLYRVPGKGTFVADIKALSDSAQVWNKAISFVVPDIDDIFISEICRGLQDAANSANCSLIIQSSNGSVAKENENIEYSMRNHIDGMAIFPNWGRANMDAIYKLKQAGMPFVLIDRYYRDIDTDYVVVDNKDGAFKATTHLIELGHRDIAHLYGTEGSANDDRLEGYRCALAAAGIVFNSDYVVKMDPVALSSMGDRFEPDQRGGYDGMKRLLALEKHPTAVFAGNDYQAIGAMEAIKNAGFKVPEDVAIVGFDDLKFSSLLGVPLTTIRQPKHEMGVKAFEILMKRIMAPPNIEAEPPIHAILKTELVKRGSCGGA